MTLDRALIYAAARDVGNRSMRRGGRKVWSKADHGKACAECARLIKVLEEISAAADKRTLAKEWVKAKIYHTLKGSI